MYTGKSSVQIYQIKIDFNVTEQIKRFVYVYIVEAKHCYLIDSGVYGCEKQIAEYMKKIDKMLDLSPNANKGQLLRATVGHVIEKAELVGIYVPSKESDGFLLVKIQLQLLFDKLTALIGGMQPQNWLSFPHKQTKGESK